MLRYGTKDAVQAKGSFAEKISMFVIMRDRLTLSYAVDSQLSGGFRRLVHSLHPTLDA